MTVTQYRKYDVMTCHTARRTFATIPFVEWNMPSALVMQATGHKSERDFFEIYQSRIGTSGGADV